MKPQIIIFIFIFLVAGSTKAQNITLLAQHEDSLEVLLNKTVQAITDEEKLNSNEHFKDFLKKTIYKSGAFAYPFEKLRMCKLKSPDESFRLFNWNIPMKDGSHKYFAYLLFPGDKKTLPRIVELTELSDKGSDLTMKTLGKTNWMGALYYDIIPFKKRNKRNYILLGWDGNSDVTNKKIIEVMSVNGSKLKFGLPVFKGDKKALRRVVFEYGKDWSMSVRYDEREKRIVFDHLSPLNPSMKGNLAFYGPDLTFDSYNLKKGNWILHKNINYDRERNSKDKNFNFPPSREINKPKGQN